MPRLLDQEPDPAETPGIAEYEIGSKEDDVVTLQIKKFSLRFPRKIEATLAMLEKKAANSLPHERRLFLPEAHSRSYELLSSYAKAVTSDNVVGDEEEMIYDRKGEYYTGYKVVSKTPEGRLEIKLARFLANGALIQLLAERKGLPWLKNLRKLTWLENLRGEISVVCSDRVSPKEAKDYLEAFAHAPY